jgi:TolB-like protein/DNA-binding winged helix-turn-helix (wHTH) protein/tetratricopeptide (TPR) repeat protein
MDSADRAPRPLDAGTGPLIIVTMAADTVALPGFTLDLHARRLVRDGGGEVELRPQALDLLCELARHPGEVVGKRELLERVWPGLVVTDDSLVQAVGDIRRAIGDERHAVVQTVPRRGYRLIPTRPATPAAPPPAPVAQPEASRPGVLASRGRRGSGWAALGALAATAAALIWWQPWADAEPVVGHVPDRPPIAVLAFATDPPGADTGRGLAEELTGELARNADLHIVAAASSFAAAAEGGDARSVARRLRARYLVDGSVRREGESLRLLVHLIDGRDGTIVWTERRDVPAPEVHRVRAELVTRIATTLHSSVRRREETLALQRPPASLDAYEWSIRALSLKHRLSPEANAEARQLLERVVEHDPGYAPAWAYLGMVEGLDWINAFSGPRRPETLARAVAHLERAVALDPRLSAPHLGLSFVLVHAGRQADAVQAGRRCRALSPSDAECLMFLAAALVFVGETAEAALMAERAMALTPLAPSYVHNFHGLVQWAGGRIAESIESMDTCLRQTPRFVPCRSTRMLALAESGRMDEARADLAVLRAAGLPMAVIEAQGVRLFADTPAARALAERRRHALRLLREADLAAAR